MRIEFEVKLDFKDVLIRPKRSTLRVSSYRPEIQPVSDLVLTLPESLESVRSSSYELHWAHSIVRHTSNSTRLPLV